MVGVPLPGKPKIYCTLVVSTTPKFCFAWQGCSALKIAEVQVVLVVLMIPMVEYSSHAPRPTKFPRFASKVRDAADIILTRFTQCCSFFNESFNMTRAHGRDLAIPW